MVKVVLLAGGYGTRLSEETTVRPKPLVEIGGKPIMWHIMKIYAHHGFNDFVVLGGYKVEAIREYFLSFQGRGNDFTLDLGTGKVDWLEARAENWRVTVLDTGIETMTAGRIKRAQKHLENERFCLTYGDGVADVDMDKLMAFHQASNAHCTLTAVTQPGRYGALHLSDDGSNVKGFREKGATDGGQVETSSDVLIDEDRVPVRIVDDEEARAGAGIIDRSRDLDAGVRQSTLELAHDRVVWDQPGRLIVLADQGGNVVEQAPRAISPGLGLDGRAT